MHLEATDIVTGMPDPESVRQLEDHLIGLPQVDLGTSHVVHGGMYARTVLIPAGTTMTGAMTNADNICVVCGDITVTTDDGPMRLVGFHVLPAKAGAKRVGVAHADTYWTALFVTDKADIQDIEAQLTDESERLLTRRDCITFESHSRLEN
jgi:hypothetical protein